MPTSSSSPPTSSRTATGKTILPPYAIKNVNGAKIGFIGMTLEGTPNIVTAAGVAGLEFKDEVETANALVPVLKKQGVNAIVVLLHEGGDLNRQPWVYNGKTYQANPNYDYVCQGGGSLRAGSPILAINEGLAPEIDMVVSGHTHQPYVCGLPDGNGKERLVTSASSFGRLYTDTTVTYDRRTSDIVRPTMAQSANKIVTRTVAKDPFQTALISTYKELVRPIASAVIGSITQDVTRTANAEWRVGARRPHRRRPAGRPDRGHRWTDAGHRVHEPGRHPRRPDLQQLALR